MNHIVPYSHMPSTLHDHGSSPFCLPQLFFRGGAIGAWDVNSTSFLQPAEPSPASQAAHKTIRAAIIFKSGPPSQPTQPRNQRNLSLFSQPAGQPRPSAGTLTDRYETMIIYVYAYNKIKIDLKTNADTYDLHPSD